MRKIQMLAVVAFAVMANVAMAQTNAIKINILSPVARTFNIAYEKAISESGSLQLGFYYTGAKAGDTKISGFGITPEYRMYLSQTPAPNGFYVAPFLRYSSLTLTSTIDGQKSEGTLSNFGGGVLVGRQWVFKEKVTFDLFIGPRYQSGSVKVKSGSDNFETGFFNGFGVRGGITLGIAF